MKKWISYVLVGQLAITLVACGSPSVTMPANPFAGVKTGANQSSAATGVGDAMKVEDLPYGTVIRLNKSLSIQGGSLISKAGVTLINGEQQPIPASDVHSGYCVLQPSRMNSSMLSYDGAKITLKAGTALQVSKTSKEDPTGAETYYQIQLQPNGFDYLFAFSPSLTASEFLKLCFGDTAIFELPKN